MNPSPPNKRENLRSRSDSRAGSTFVEVLVAGTITLMMCIALYGVGLKARELAETNRLATEARSLAKERLEEIIAVGRLNLAKASCTLTSASTHLSSLGYTITRQPRVVWHNADRAVVDAVAAAYAEVHVDVSYRCPLRDLQLTDTYSTIIQ